MDLRPPPAHQQLAVYEGAGSSGVRRHLALSSLTARPRRSAPRSVVSTSSPINPRQPRLEASPVVPLVSPVRLSPIVTGRTARSRRPPAQWSPGDTTGGPTAVAVAGGGVISTRRWNQFDLLAATRLEGEDGERGGVSTNGQTSKMCIRMKPSTSVVCEEDDQGLHRDGER